MPLRRQRGKVCTKPSQAQGPCLRFRRRASSRPGAAVDRRASNWRHGAWRFLSVCIGYAPCPRAQPEQVRDMVHGAIFTRGPKDLARTAFFIGGSDVTAGEMLLSEVRGTCCRSLACACRFCSTPTGPTLPRPRLVLPLSTSISRLRQRLSWAALGPLVNCTLAVGGQGADVRLGSRQPPFAIRLRPPLSAPGSAAVTDYRRRVHPSATCRRRRRRALSSFQPASAILLPKLARMIGSTLCVAIDLNAVPPAN